MRKTLVLFLLLAASTSFTALADTAMIVGIEFSSKPGGEFTMLPGGFGNSGYAPETRNLVQNGTFQTFCLEMNEAIKTGIAYNATPNTVTVSTGFTLTKAVAWLYQQFAGGKLSDYDYTPAGRVASAGNLQQEIWHLMGNQAPANPIFDPIVNAAAAGWVGGVNAVNDTPVVVLNLSQMVGGVRTEAQDVLYTPGNPNTRTVPDGGLTLALLGIGLTGVGFVSRRARK
jgi:hypothetical protein